MSAQPWPRTELLALLGIEHPIIQAPMAGAVTPELVAAVSNAGGLGAYGAAGTPPDALSAVIRRIKSLTDRPFGVNLFAPGVEDCEVTAAKHAAVAAVLRPYYAELDAGAVPDIGRAIGPFDEQLTVVLEEGVAVFSFHFGPPPADAIQALKTAGVHVMASATTVAEAILAVEAGADAIIAQGAEAGGHRNTYTVPYERGLIGVAALTPAIADAVSVPVVAAGGIMDGRGIAAAFALDACGVQMGTAFLGCPENDIGDTYRDTLLTRNADDCIITEAFSGRPARGLRNRFTEEMRQHRDRVLPFPAQNAVTGALRQAAKRRGNPDFMSLWAGQGVGLARALPAAELIETLVREFKAVQERISR